MIDSKDYNVGVIVARFQCAELHPGHEALLKYVSEYHTRVLVFIGTSPAIGTRENPLEFEERADVVRSIFPYVTILPLPDTGDDQSWSDNLDKQIRNLFPIDSVLLYGGRDSFINSYKGHYKTKIIGMDLLVAEATSATELRVGIGKQKPINSVDFRKGIIYASQRQYPKVFPVVDMGIVQIMLPENYDGMDGIGGPPTEYHVLLGQKSDVDYWQLPGGFVSPHDQMLEIAASRETKEETNLDIPIDLWKYVTSQRIKDWRYSGTDRIHSSLFTVESIANQNNIVKAADDLNQVKWFSLSQAHLYVSGMHRDHIVALQKFYKVI